MSIPVNRLSDKNHKKSKLFLNYTSSRYTTIGARYIPTIGWVLNGRRLADTALLTQWENQCKAVTYSNLCLHSFDNAI